MDLHFRKHNYIDINFRSVVEASAARRRVKVVKGARDFVPSQMVVRDRAFRAITRVFQRHGAKAIDTPVTATSC